MSTPAPMTRRKSVTMVALPSPAGPRRGRPPTTLFVNVRVRASTRVGLTRLKRKLGLSSQGAVLDQLVAEKLARAKR